MKERIKQEKKRIERNGKNQRKERGRQINR